MHNPPSSSFGERGGAFVRSRGVITFYFLLPYFLLPYFLLPYFLLFTSCLSAVRFAKEGSVWLGGLIMLERCTENLRTRFRVTDALFHKKLLERVAIFHIKRPLDLLGSATGNAIRDRFERLMPID